MPFYISIVTLYMHIVYVGKIYMGYVNVGAGVKMERKNMAILAAVIVVVIIGAYAGGFFSGDTGPSEEV